MKSLKTLLMSGALVMAAPALAQMQPAQPQPAQPQPAERPAYTQERTAERITDETKARQKLASKGYASVERIEQRADGTFAATVMKDNRREQVVVHADGRVTPGS
jgi:hypothetical protein